MFSAHVSALRACVAERQAELHQRDLNEMRWSVRRDLCALADGRVLSDLEFAIASASSPSHYRAALKTYSRAEVEAPIRNGAPSLAEVLTGTDVLERVGNCLAPGFFKCTFRRELLRDQPERFLVEVTFVAARFDAPKPPCTCVLAARTVGFCAVCGGHGNRVVMNPEDDDAD
uniref:Uncharacterized protein n=1 Tax=viral metagenome TaxID=1070528 RepID=A0A6C0KUS5_9ZZZZ